MNDGGEERLPQLEGQWLELGRVIDHCYGIFPQSP